MREFIMLLIIITVLQSFRVAIYFLRSDDAFWRKILEAVILSIMVVLCYYELGTSKGWGTFYLSIIFSLYVVIMFIIERMFGKNYISILSIKSSIDMSYVGILFLDNKGNIILINEVMRKILNDFNINKDYINNLIDKCFRTMLDSYLLRNDDKIYQLKIKNNMEITLIDVTEIYKLQEQEEMQNRKIQNNNKKILETINNMEKIEKTKNLLKIKNEYHDRLGYRLALFTKYLEQDKRNVDDIRFLLERVYEEDNEECIDKRINNFIKMYKIIGVNVHLRGKFLNDEKVKMVVFEVIREAVTNAIIHANSKNILINVWQYFNRFEMVITNDGEKPLGVIYENEGIRGMRRKLSFVNGSLFISTKDGFRLKVIIEKKAC